ncbi:partner of Y14 and mago-like [Lytechinus pictus]|uniref:partner of Y14 and mago-like n=1 Tax=Lytechinus pictus TaxID=7653 RepID=UPI0030B9E04D
MMASAAKENVETDESGQFLPATQRPDGTWRKPRRVKPGYIPQEEVPLYESKGKQWINSKPRLPPGVYEDPVPAKVEESKALTKAAKKNEKRRQKRKEKQNEVGEVQNGDVEQLRKGVQEVSVGGGADPAPVLQDPQKRIKNLKKKIRQIEDLEAKIASGEVAQPSKEQLEKIARKGELEDELDLLEDGS